MKLSIKLLFLTFFAVFAVQSLTLSPCYATEYSFSTSVKASHILVDTKAEAEMIKSKIDSGKSFESMAQQYSKCPSGKEGGDLGYFERGQMVKEFENVAFSLPIGKVSEPVRTDFGWHLIKVYDKK